MITDYIDALHPREAIGTGRFALKSYSRPETALIVHPTPTEIFDTVSSAFRSAFEQIPTDWVAVQNGGDHVRAAFSGAADRLKNSLAAAKIGKDDPDFDDQVVIDQILEVADRSNMHTVGYSERAIVASAALARRIIQRDRNRPDSHTVERDNHELQAGDVLVGDSGFRMPIVGVRPRGAEIEIETPFGPMTVPSDGVQFIAVMQDNWDADDRSVL